MILLNKEIHELCSKYNIQTEHHGSAMSLIMSIYNNENIFIFDENNYSLHVLRKLLVLDGLISENITEKGVILLLTNKAISLIHEYDLIYQRITNNKESNRVTSSEEWIDEWRNLWKDKNNKFIRTPSNMTLGISKKDAITKMDWFLDNYGDMFTSTEEAKNVILKSTQKYLHELSKSGYAFCKRPNNFISKREDKTKDSLYSTLAAECENYLENGNFKEEIKSNGFKRST